jgi:hypothetical protein
MINSCRQLLQALASLSLVAALGGCAMSPLSPWGGSTASCSVSDSGSEIASIFKRADGLLKEGSVEEAQRSYYEAISLLDDKLGTDYYCKISYLAEKASTSLNSDDGEALCKRLIAIDADMSLARNSHMVQDLELYSKWLRVHKRTAAAEELARLSERCKLPGSQSRSLNAEICSALKLRPPMQEDLVVHSVLQTRAGHSGDEAKIDDTTFIKLNGYLIPSGAYSGTWNEYFAAAERAAVAKFCTLARGLTKKQVERLGGRPLYRGGRVDCWNFGSYGEDVWVYCFGGSSVFARLAFGGDCCSSAEIVGADDLSRYKVWRAKDLERNALGKTVFMILQEQGTPAYIETNHGIDLFGCRNPLHYTSVAYETSPHASTELTFLYGFCVKTQSHTYGSPVQ